jgi:hypothetical protein
MNDNSTAAATASQRPSPSVPFEQRIFELSPLGSLPTAIAIFVLLVASFEACAVLSHYPLSEQLSFSPQEGAWPAIILSLLVAVALGMQRYASTKELEDGPALARVTSRDAWAGGTIDVGTPNALRWAGFAGSVCGFGISFLVVPPSVQPAHLAVFLWFAFAMAFAFALFARGLVTSLSVARDFADRLDRGLKIDLLRIDDLSVIGRAGARAALVWLSAAAVVSLFFVIGQA